MSVRVLRVCCPRSLIRTWLHSLFGFETPRLSSQGTGDQCLPNGSRARRRAREDRQRTEPTICRLACMPRTRGVAGAGPIAGSVGPGDCRASWRARHGQRPATSAMERRRRLRPRGRGCRGPIWLVSPPRGAVGCACAVRRGLAALTLAFRKRLVGWPLSVSPQPRNCPAWRSAARIPTISPQCSRWMRSASGKRSRLNARGSNPACMRRRWLLLSPRCGPAARNAAVALIVRSSSWMALHPGFRLDSDVE
jgi:hypothetical protein